MQTESDPSLCKRVPVTPLIFDQPEETGKIIRLIYSRVENQVFEPWIGLKAIHPFAEWVPADPHRQAAWAIQNDHDAKLVLIDVPDYGPYAALAGMHPRMAIGNSNDVVGVSMYGLDSDVEYSDIAEPAWILHGRLWDDVWRAQSSALCSYLLTCVYAQTPNLSISELLKRTLEGQTAVTGGGTYLNRYGARTNSGWYRCAPAMCSIGSRGNDYPDEPATCYALDAHVTLLEPLLNGINQAAPTIPIRHALQQCTLPDGESLSGHRVWTCLNNDPDNYIKELEDVNGVFLISVLGASIASLTSIVMLEGYYDWLVSILFPDLPHGLYLSQLAQSALRHVARTLKDKNMKQEEESVVKNWLKEVLMQNVDQQVAEVVLVNRLTWGTWLAHIVLNDQAVSLSNGVFHELTTGMFTEEVWSTTVDSHWEAIKKAIVSWDVDWENLNDLSITLPHIVDRLPSNSSLSNSSLEWMKNGQITYALINMKAHPYLDLEWVSPGSDASCYSWEPDSTLCRFYEDELYCTSHVDDGSAVELTWEEDLTPGKNKKVIRVQAVLGIIPELTNFLSQYMEKGSSWVLGDVCVPDKCPLSKLTPILEKYFVIDRIQAMTLILALAACGVFHGTGAHDCWSQVGSNELVDGIKTIDCDIPIELAGRLVKARKLNRTFFVVPLTPNEAAVFDVGDSHVVEKELNETPELHATRGWMHSETGIVEDWLAGIEQEFIICKLGMRRLRSKAGSAAQRPLSGPVPPGSSLEWVVRWAEERLGIVVPLSNDELERDGKTMMLKVRRNFWKLFKCETITGSMSVQRLIGVSVEFKRMYGGILRVNTWVALEKVIRDLATQAGVVDSSAADYVSISEVANCLLWYSTLCDLDLKVGPKEKAVWVAEAQRGDGFLCDRNMLVAKWMGRRLREEDALEVLVTEKQAVNFGAGSVGGSVRSYQTVSIPTTGHIRGEFSDGLEICLSCSEPP